MRKIQFVNGEYYHIYNRGVEKIPIFRDEEDYLKFKRGLRDFNNQSYYEERAAIVRKYGFKELSSFFEKVESSGNSLLLLAPQSFSFNFEAIS
jgi:hypothetical protein